MTKWRDPTLDANFEETYDLPRQGQMRDRLWGLAGLFVFFAIGMMVASGWT